jgi:NAD(P)-dependent dehydrogenase (short-subunit alcohol dehydrogenase family)
VIKVQLKPVGEQVVVLMGASSGIGRETALRFARKGAKVVASARGEEGLDSLVQEIRDEGGEAIAVPADTSEFGQVKAVADRAVQEYGRLDTWVHLAAVGLFATFEETTPEEFERVVDVNLTGRSTARWPRSRT